MKRWQIIQAFIDKFNYKRYLEIGIFRGKTFGHIRVAEKIGVDPRVVTDYKMDSDRFFREYHGCKFDVVFIDGCHNGDCVLRDAMNSMSICDDIILMHDCKPTSELTQMRENHPCRTKNTWHGTAWRAWLYLRSKLPYEMYVIDSDNGVGVINKRNKCEKTINYSLCLMEYVDFAKRQRELLNLVSVDEFKEKIRL